jgi:hypothetical protein
MTSPQRNRVTVSEGADRGSLVGFVLSTAEPALVQRVRNPKAAAPETVKKRLLPILRCNGQSIFRNG